MSASTVTSLSEPRLEEVKSRSIVGISRHYPFGNVSGLPDQWQSFAEILPTLCNEANPTTYGVIYNSTDNSFDYLTGVDTPVNQRSIENVVKLDLAAQSYLVFKHVGHVATVRDTCNAIWSDWLPSSEMCAVEAPWFERYGDAFDAGSGHGGLEIWIPVTKVQASD